MFGEWESRNIVPEKQDDMEKNKNIGGVNLPNYCIVCDVLREITEALSYDCSMVLADGVRRIRR